MTCEERREVMIEGSGGKERSGKEKGEESQKYQHKNGKRFLRG
jgi:hypothetical protein